MPALRTWPRTARITVVAVVTLMVSVIAAAAASGADPNEPAASESSTGTTQAEQPNIVYVLTDDMSADLLQYMAEVDKLKAEGTTMENFVYGDSLCCPSRATILTGKFPHNTGVLTNNAQDLDGDGQADGGLKAFRRWENRTIATALQDAGYRTGMMGKYLNGYKPIGSSSAPDLYVPPGWDEWHVAGGGGYNQMRYTMTRKIDGNKIHETQFEDPVNSGPYLTDVLAYKAENFIKRSVNRHPDQPFFLKISPFAPHSKVGPAPDDPYPFVPAPRDRADPDAGFPGDCGQLDGEQVDCSEVRAPRGGAFDKAVENGPSWLRDEPLTQAEIDKIDQKYLLRVQMMQAVDDLIGRVRAKLDEFGVAENTYIVFGSDNGFHLGEHRLLVGKGTVFGHDSTVPLTVVGPDVRADQTRRQLVQNVDMYRTFLDMAGVQDPRPSNGRSILGLLGGGGEWQRQAAFLEHTHKDGPVRGDPDAHVLQGNVRPATYTAIRTADEVYAKYHNGEEEYYDLTEDPNQLVNQAAELTDQRRALLDGWRKDLANCGQGPPTLACYDASQHPNDR